MCWVSLFQIHHRLHLNCLICASHPFLLCHQAENHCHDLMQLMMMLTRLVLLLVRTVPHVLQLRHLPEEWSTRFHSRKGRAWDNRRCPQRVNIGNYFSEFVVLELSTLCLLAAVIFLLSGTERTCFCRSGGGGDLQNSNGLFLRTSPYGHILFNILQTTRKLHQKSCTKVEFLPLLNWNIPLTE